MVEAALGSLLTGRGLSNRTTGMMRGFGAGALTSTGLTSYLTTGRLAAGSKRQVLA